MGYGGKVAERERARELRAQAWTLPAIAEELGVAKSSVSTWVRDVQFSPSMHGTSARRREPNRLQRLKADEIRHGLERGRQRVGQLSEREFLVAGAALYAGEGAKTDGAVGFTNTDPAMIAFFCAWLRQFFDIDEQRMRARLYLHEGLDLTTAMSYWRALTRIPESQFLQPYRAPADATRRRAKHTRGCLTITYSCSRTHREIMGLLKALLALPALRTPDASATQDCW